MIGFSRHPVEVLLGARDLLLDEARWCKGSKARRADGSKCHPGDPLAISWDIEGAIGISDNPRGFTPIPLLYLIDRATRELYPTPVRYQDIDTKEEQASVWEYGAYETADYVNDWLGHAAVLRVLDRSIELAREEYADRDPAE